MDDLDRGWDRPIGERVRLCELRILHAVVRCGSMAKAAAALAITQPAVSQAIGLLEAALGVPIVERSPAGVRPTEFGEAMLRRTLDAVDALSEGIREVALLSDPDQGRIVVGASESYIAGGALARTIQAVGQRYPRMRIDVVESNTAAMDFADPQNRWVDVMLGRVAIDDLQKDMHVHRLGDEALFVVAGGQHVWARQPRITFADLAGRLWVLAPPGSAVYELVAAAFRTEGTAMPSVAITTWSMVLRLQLLSSGDYVTAFPESLVRDNATRWNLGFAGDAGTPVARRRLHAADPKAKPRHPGVHSLRGRAASAGPGWGMISKARHWHWRRYAPLQGEAEERTRGEFAKAAVRHPGAGHRQGSPRHRPPECAGQGVRRPRTVG